MKTKRTDRRKRITQWIKAGTYAVAVEVDVVYPAEDPSEPCYTPETVRLLEKVENLAQRRDWQTLEQIGTVYVRQRPVRSGKKRRA